MEDNRKEKEYAFILAVGKELSKLIACGWWCTEEDKISTKCGMSAAARAFKKTAGILVYEKEQGTADTYKYCDCCDIKHDLIIPSKVCIENGRITKLYYRDYGKEKESYIINVIEYSK